MGPPSSLSKKYKTSANHSVNEYTLHQGMCPDEIEERCKTFITELDFATEVGAEPFLLKVVWKWVALAILHSVEWTRKYGIRINFDLHAVLGSQNGRDHSGRLGPDTVSSMYGMMGHVNGRWITTESSPSLLLNLSMKELSPPPLPSTSRGRSFRGTISVLSTPNLIGSFVRSDPGKGSWVSIHDGMLVKGEWICLPLDVDRLTLDAHPYMGCGDQTVAGRGAKVTTPCTRGEVFTKSMDKFGLTNAGEFSSGINDCGLFLNGVDRVRYEGTYIYEKKPRVGSCTQWTDWENYSDTTKAELTEFALGSFDALQIGGLLASGKVETPAWSYKLDVDNGWVPKDPRIAAGICGSTSPWADPLSTGNRNIDTAPYPWPLIAISSGNPLCSLPTLTAAGAIPTLTGGTTLNSRIRTESHYLAYARPTSTFLPNFNTRS
ncbi:hypothetical protein V5O48_004194 [Marasmius crinis-equi]|uniref:glucan 1,3-beta-glucosidase n=1 Tax=Marasmius crinis-equi TaxID=585013 RepID=A0ABR3FQR5_9AGAR